MEYKESLNWLSGIVYAMSHIYGKSYDQVAGDLLKAHTRNMCTDEPIPDGDFVPMEDRQVVAEFDSSAADTIAPKKALRFIVDSTDKPVRKLSKDIGRSESFISSTMTHGAIPSIATFSAICRAAGAHLLLKTKDGTIYEISDE